MKILNLFAGIGGNRKYWTGHEIFAVEKYTDILNWYQQNFPVDTCILADVREFLQYPPNLAFLKTVDFVWASPPCQSHSRLPKNSRHKRIHGQAVSYDIPDMTQLYGLITWLKYFTKKHNKNMLWAVENVQPWYKPLIEPNAILGRHLFWSNFVIQPKKFNRVTKIDHLSVRQMKDLYGLGDYPLPEQRPFQRRDQVYRNCVDPYLGQYVLAEAQKNIRRVMKIADYLS